ncbi:MAG: ATP-binding cassette domain-containing protein [Planctomycetota bacterium]
MSASPEFQKIIRLRSFARPALLPAAVSGILSGLVLMILIGICGLLASLLLIQSGSDGSKLDLGQVCKSMSEHPIGRSLAGMASALPQNSAGSLITLLIALIAGCLIIRRSLKAVAATFVGRHVTSAILRLRQHVHRKAIRLEPADLSGEQTRVADTLFRIDAHALEASASRWGTLWVNEATDLFFACLTALLIDPKVALQVVIPVILGQLLIRMERVRGDASRRLLTEQVGRSLAKMAEGLRKTRIVTSFGMENTEHQQFEAHLKDYGQRCRQMEWQHRLGSGLQSLIQLILVLIPLCLLAIHILRGGNPAAAIMFAGCLLVIACATDKMEQLNLASTEGSQHAEEIASYLNRIPSVSQTPGASFLQPMAKTLSFNQLSFQTPQYPELIHNLDLRVNAGERIALLSLDSKAAYALASMIPRFVDPDLGQVLIDGRDIRGATLESLRAEAIFVGGDDPVFNASVLENITCGQPDITRQQAIDAAKLVHADSLIRALPKGYETPLGEHGISLDAGQMFRLNLARAAVRQPALLIIEEPTVSLDQETKALLDDAYQRICTNRTVIFLPHRLSTVKRCSRIILLHQGQIAVDGVHDRLVKSSELYRHWEYVRFNPFRDETE